MTAHQPIFAIVPAAGLGMRMNGAAGARSKILLELQDGLSVLARTVRNLAAADIFDALVIAVRREDEASVAAVCAHSGLSIPYRLVMGGATRQESVLNALRAVSGQAQFVAVHDAARPFCPPELIRRVVAAALITGAAILGLPLSSTVKRVDAHNFVSETVPRDSLWQAQTPQVFRLELLLNAYQAAEAQGFSATDESQLVERTGHQVTIVPGDALNIKLTTPDDLKLAELIVGRS